MKRGILFLFLCIIACHSSKPLTVLKPLVPVDPATTGTIRGVVRFEGLPPASAKIPLAQFAQCANPKGTDDDVLIQDGKVQNAFVYIKEGVESYAFPPASGEVTLDQKGCLYEPRVVGLRVGQTLAVKNSDAFLHNVHALPKYSHAFNMAMAQAGTEIRKNFDAPEVMVAIRCDVHPWMRAYVGVLSHPLFAVTGPDGVFEIHGVPPGTYTLEAWHERLGTKTMQVTIGAKETIEAHFLLTPNPSPR